MSPFFALLLLAAEPAPTDVPAAEATSLYQSALAAYQAGKCDEAMPDLKTLAAAGYHASEAAVALRDCYEKKWGTDGAITELEKETQTAPGDPVAHANLGCFYLAKGRFEEAQKEITRALEIAPKNLDARLDLAFWYAQVGQSRAAISEQESILKEDPENKRALTELCYLVAERENDAKRAEPFCARAAAGQEGNEMVGVTLGLVRMRAGDLDGAEKAFQTVLEKNPEAHSARTFFGVTRLQRGDYPGAEKAFQEVLAKDPGDNDARLGLARTYQARKDFSGAVEQYKVAYAKDRNGMVLGALVKAYLQQYFLLVIGLLLGAMSLLLWRYLNVRAPASPAPAG